MDKLGLPFQTEEDCEEVVRLKAHRKILCEYIYPHDRSFYDEI